MRCASVAGVTRNARAISSVVSPQIAQGERNLSFRRQSGMAAGEDQTQTIIFDLVVIDHLAIYLFANEGSLVDARFRVGN